MYQHAQEANEIGVRCTLNVYVHVYSRERKRPTHSQNNRTPLHEQARSRATRSTTGARSTRLPASWKLATGSPGDEQAASGVNSPLALPYNLKWATGSPGDEQAACGVNSLSITLQLEAGHWQSGR